MCWLCNCVLLHKNLAVSERVCSKRQLLLAWGNYCAASYHMITKATPSHQSPWELAFKSQSVIGLLPRGRELCGRDDASSLVCLQQPQHHQGGCYQDGILRILESILPSISLCKNLKIIIFLPISEACISGILKWTVSINKHFTIICEPWFYTPGLLATDIHIQILIFLTISISGDYFWWLFWP